MCGVSVCVCVCVCVVLLLVRNVFSKCRIVHRVLVHTSIANPGSFIKPIYPSYHYYYCKVGSESACGAGSPVMQDAIARISSNFVEQALEQKRAAGTTDNLPTAAEMQVRRPHYHGIGRSHDMRCVSRLTCTAVV